MHDAVVHRGVERVERGGLDEELVRVAVAERQPLLAIVALAGPADVGAVHPPRRVDVVEPERRGPGPDRHVDEHRRVVLAQLAGDVEQGHEVRAHAIPGAVPLEGVDAAFAHQLAATIDEPLLVLGVGEVEFGVGRDESLFLRLGGAFLVAAVAAQRRDPDAEVGAERIHLGLGRGEAAGELLFVLHPEALGRLVPAVVDEVGEHRHAPLLHEFRVEGPDHVEHARFIDAEPEVIPAVVMQEGAAGAGALALDVAQERTTELAGRGEAGDGAEVVGLLRGERERATEGGATARRGDEVGRPGHLDPCEEAGAGERAARTGADLFQPRCADVGEFDPVEFVGFAVGGQQNRLPEVVGTVTQFGPPAGLHAAVRGEIGLQGLTVLQGQSAHLAHDAESGSG